MESGEFQVLLKRKIRKYYYKSRGCIQYSKYRHRNHITALVYTMGKVGSSTIYETMFKELPFSKSFHIHFLSDDWLDGYLVGTPYESHNRKAAQAYVQHRKRNPGKRLKIISLVRDPIARDISDFFQNYMKEGYPIEDLSVPEIVEIIQKRGHGFCLKWFETEFNAYLDINIYECEFDKDRGYSFYHFKNYDLIVIQVEKLNFIFSEALRELFGFDVACLVRSNESGKKIQPGLYSQIKDEYFLDENTLQQIYSSRYCRHFYSSEDLNAFMDAWRMP